MNYRKIYNDLIGRSRGRTLIEYTESHHIIPRCIGGNNKSENLCRLTAEEHFLAHLLLVKIYPDIPKLALAARYMCFDSNGRRRNNKMFGWVRRAAAKAMSVIQTGRIPTPETVAKRAASQKGRLGGMKDKKHKASSKEQTSKALAGRPKPPRTATHCENLSISHMNSVQSTETRDKISNTTKNISYEERYGPEQAILRKEKLRLAWIERKSKKLNRTSQE